MSKKQKQDDPAQVLRLAREKSGTRLTILFEDGSRHVIQPTKAFTGSWKDLTDHIAHGRPYKIERNHTEQ